MLNDLMDRGHRCFACGSHEPFGHNAGSKRGTGSPGAPGIAAPGSAGGPGAAGIELHPSTLAHLASILCIAYRGVEITRLLERSGFTPRWNHSGTDWQFLYRVLEGQQRDFGPHGVLQILRTACSPSEGPGRDGMREELNACLSSHGLRMGEDGVARPEARTAPGGGDAGLLGRLGHHPAVIEHAGRKFLKGEYHGAVTEGCKALEEIVRKKSGIDGYGVRLMKRALGGEGILEVAHAGLTDTTRAGRQSGLEGMCVGIVSGVRNPVSHEPESSLGIGREDALHILGTISYLCGQVEGTRRRRGTGRVPAKDAKSGTGGSAARDHAAVGQPMDSPKGNPAPQAAGKGGVEELAVAPESVEKGGTVSVTVTGRGIGGWHVEVSSEEGKVKSPPTRLEAFARHAALGDGRLRYSFPVTALGYEPGVYRVSVSSDKKMDAVGLRIAKFAVTSPMPIAVSLGRLDPDMGYMRRRRPYGHL